MQFAEQPHCRSLPKELEGSSLDIVVQQRPAPARPGQGSPHGGPGMNQDWTSGRPPPMMSQPGQQGQQANPQGDSRDWRARDPAVLQALSGAPRTPPGGMHPGMAGRGGARENDRWGKAPLPPQAGAGGVLQMFDPNDPVNKLQKAEELGRKAWAPNVAGSDTDKVMRQIRGVLNKLTPEKFDRLFEQLLEKITSADILKKSITTIFEKAVAEPTFCFLYAELCLRLSKEVPEFPGAPAEDGTPGKPMAFRRVLLNTCQEEFEGANGQYEALAEVEESAREKAATAVKRRMLGNVRLIGLLFVKGVLNHKIIHVCLNMMLSQEKEDYIEAVCEMLSLNSSNRSLGRLLEEVGGGKAGAKSAGKELMKGYFSKLQQLMKTGDMPSRVRFMIRELEDLKKARWHPRKQKQEAKTIDEIHAEAAAQLGVAMPHRGLKPLPGMRTKADEDRALLPGFRGGQADGWAVVGKKGQQQQHHHHQSNMLEGGKFSALVGQAPAPAARGGPPGPADSGAADDGEKLDPKSPEAMTKKIENTLDEYISVGDAAEALMCIKELGAPNTFLPKIVEMIVEKILDNAKPREKELLTKLALATVQRGALTLDMFLEGFKFHSDQLEDSMLDIPLAPTLLGDFFCTSVSDKVLQFSHISGLCEKIEGGEARRALVGAILKRFRSLKGEVYVTEACKGAQLPLGELLKLDELDPPDLPTTEEFLKELNLGSLPLAY